MYFLFLKKFFSKKKISSKSLLIFTYQLANLIQAGMPVLPSLLMLEEQQSQGFFKQLISQLIASLQEGKSFSSALSEHPTCFSNDYQSMVRAGEQGGILGGTLNQLALLEEKRQQLQQKVFSILLYPTIVLITAFLIIGLLFFFIIPKFEAIFSEIFSEKTLPALTQFILDLSRSIKENPHLLVLGSISLLGGVLFFSKTNTGRLWRDHLFLKTPFLKSFFRKNILARFTRTVGTLLTHGVPLLQALELGKETTGSHSVDPLFEKIHDSIQCGNAMATSLREHAFFPPMVVSMIEVGEATGQLPKIFLNLASFYETEIENATKNFFALLEPTIIFSLALLIGTIVVALFLPLVTMMGEMGN